MMLHGKLIAGAALRHLVVDVAEGCQEDGRAEFCTELEDPLRLRPIWHHVTFHGWLDTVGVVPLSVILWRTSWSRVHNGAAA